MDFDNNRPIYLQIVEYLYEQILNNSLNVNDKLPSVRDLANQLSVTPNTATRSYMILQQQGVVSSQRGIGLFVNEKAPSIVQTIRKKEFIETELPQVFRTLDMLNMQLDELNTLYGAYKNSAK